MSTKKAPVTNLINHILFVVDRSGSMDHLSDSVIKVFDNQVAFLAKRSQETGQETRVTVFLFGSTVECVIYDKDVLRMPSLADLYRIEGMTALIDATIQSLDDMDMTPQKYGDHAFLGYVITDGQENESKHTPVKLKQRLAALANNWTMAILVPDESGRQSAIKFGFPEGNIDVWDARSAKGVEAMGARLAKLTDHYMTARASGVRQITNLMTLDLSNLKSSTVKATLDRIDPKTYRILPVNQTASIRDFIENETGLAYTAGMAFYQLMKPETVQTYKACFIRDRKTGAVYGGDAARQMLGLPTGANVKVTSNMLGDFDVFVQSTSFNRKLVPGTSLLVSTTA